MKKKFIPLILFISFLFSGTQPVYYIPLQGDIDMGLPYFIERGVAQAEQNDAKVIIFDVDTFGGRVDAATRIKDAILSSKVPTIAFINRRAISAGSLISLSCDSIYMTSGATIGAATAVDQSGKKTSEKVISYMREEMASTAEANGRSRDIAAAMVDEELSIDYQVTVGGDTLRADDIEGFKSGKLITLSTKTAIALGIADREIETLDQLLQFLGESDARMVRMRSSWSEKLVRFLTSPTVAPLLMTLGFLGLLFEIKSPGFGFPGAAGLLLLALFFGSHLLVGLADISEIILLAFGILLVLLEIFVIPGFGITGIAGGLLILWSMYQMLLGTHPGPEETRGALYGLNIGIVGGVIAGVFFFKFLVRSRLYQRAVPYTPQKKSQGYSISQGYEKLIGRVGVATSDLRPAGTADISGERYQVMTTGEYLIKGVQIEVKGIDENQLIVTAVRGDKTTGN